MAALLGVSACSAAATSSGPAAGSTQQAGSTQPTGSTPQQAGSGIIPAHSTLHWHSCSRQLAAYGVHDCTMLSVPLNYADPGGRHISLALDMMPATAPKSQQQGIMLVNPGGPGASGLPWAPILAQGLSRGVAADYDIVGFDPRGVGSSVPALSCDPGFFSGVRPNYIPANAAAEQVLINRAKTYATDCEQRFGWLLPYMTTEDTARDMDSIRAAFGVSKINYYAFSYGTYIGQVYATLFPGHLRRMVLDSTVDPTGVWYANNVAQDYAFQGRIEAFFAWVAKYDGTYHLGRTAAQVQAAWYRARNQLLAHPVNAAIGADEFDDTFLLGGYFYELWPGLAQALSSYLNAGQTVGMINQYQANGAQNENEFAVYNAVQCSDVNWPRSFAYWTSDTERIYKPGPVRGLGQHLVQRRVRVLAGAGAGQAAADQGGRAAGHLDAAGHAGRRHPVRGRPGRAQAAAVRADGRGRGQRPPRAVVRAAFEPLRAGLRERLPRHRGAAGGPGAGQRHLPGRARSRHPHPDENFLRYCPV